MKRSEEMESSVCDLLERSEKIVGQGEGGGGRFHCIPAKAVIERRPARFESRGDAAGI